MFCVYVHAYVYECAIASVYVQLHACACACIVRVQELYFSFWLACSTSFTSFFRVTHLQFCICSEREIACAATRYNSLK